jgi:hypothetical protein
MDQRVNILQELKELNSELTAYGQQDTYVVPAGYFDNLLNQVMSRIKALEAVNAADELTHLSPELGKLSKQIPYSIPGGYFETLAERILRTIHEGKELQSSIEETESISPFLAGLKKDLPYSVPQGYFETFTPGKGSKATAKVVSLGSRKWFRYAAAAVVIGIMATLSIFIIEKNKVSADKDSYAWVKKNIKKVSTENLDEFIQLTENEQTVAATEIKPQEVKEFIKDIPEEEIQDLLNDTRILDEEETNDTAGEESLMN